MFHAIFTFVEATGEQSHNLMLFLDFIGGFVGLALVFSDGLMVMRKGRGRERRGCFGGARSGLALVSAAQK